MKTSCPELFGDLIQDSPSSWAAEYSADQYTAVVYTVC